MCWIMSCLNEFICFFLENDKDSSIILNTNKDTKVNFEQLLSTTLFSIKSVLSLIATQDLSKNLEETLNYFKSTFNVQKSDQSIEYSAIRDFY
ncbi:unnamed protein product [Rotaria sordida]|uniref:Uncharacterized protein n=1 Tax=Rotaria sordida TaxID=392033 RepID=A0A814BCF8_9BILA|nr:unnamed protein product [Rotaria sordida]CAF0951474.1 unnamed protein product [Rotaria sordida]